MRFFGKEELTGGMVRHVLQRFDAAAATPAAT